MRREVCTERMATAPESTPTPDHMPIRLNDHYAPRPVPVRRQGNRKGQNSIIVNGEMAVGRSGRNSHSDGGGGGGRRCEKRKVVGNPCKGGAGRLNSGKAIGSDKSRIKGGVMVSRSGSGRSNCFPTNGREERSSGKTTAGEVNDGRQNKEKFIFPTC